MADSQAGSAAPGNDGSWANQPRTRRSTDHTWLTADEAAHYLGLRTRMALYQAVRRGQIPAHHLGRRLRFRRSELDALLSSNR